MLYLGRNLFLGVQKRSEVYTRANGVFWGIKARPPAVPRYRYLCRAATGVYKLYLMATISTPKRIYIESTALIQLGQKLENVDFEKLLQLRDSAGFRIYVSEVSWLEYIRKRKKDLAFFLDSCSKAERVLEKHGRAIPEIAKALDKAKEYLANIDAHYRERAHRRGIEIIGLAPVGLDRLLKMSIECTRPFEEAEDESREKGFRDSLIMFSILESLRGRSDECAVVITQDQLLADAFNSHAAEFGASLVVVRTLDDATTHIVNTLAESERARIKQESVDAIGMLDSYEETIGSKIAEIQELTDAAERESLAVRGIRSIKFDRIDSAVWKDKDKTRSRILFRCLCKVTVIIRAPQRIESAAEARRFKVGERPQATSGLVYSLDFGTPYYEPTEERELPIDMYGVAELQRGESSLDWELLSINMDKSVPAEEYNALVAAEISQTNVAGRPQD